MQLDSLHLTNINPSVKEHLKTIKTILQCSSYVDLMKAEHIHQALKDVVLLMLYLVLPEIDLKEDIKKTLSISVENIESITHYIDALQSSGVEDISRGMLMVSVIPMLGKPA